ncbi:hypothetical protein JWG45_11680 [Leptospira sp. 201903070]|uniref:Lipoprotein n=1 Tax=Leptospira ainlahdjerensis TaxID=2810033 RepID=A0ABS2UBT0_9LEPT|nr:putative zinc-binding metallopeptidase [Leptospira ainlahdjerensis]MBM9577810.1 hypothetical protein [Leptospira ainlahdjerensis]
MNQRIVTKIAILLLLSNCAHKKEVIDESFLFLLLPKPDRAENYDRDVQIITHTEASSDSFNCNATYAQEDVEHYSFILRAQIAKYPRGYWIKSKVEKVVLCANLTVGGVAVGGFMDPLSNRIYMNVSAGITTGVMDDYIDRSIHHEITHNFDFTLRGFLMDVHSDWVSLNTVEYSTNVDWSSPTLLQFNNPVPGFVTTYSASNVAEDYAEISSGLMGPQFNYNQLIQICQTDPVVAAKVKLMITDMKNFWPFPGAEGTFWKTKVETTSCP